MHVALFASCLVDQCWPSAAVATVRLLRRAGCQVSYDPAQTCCGQPAFNSGYRHHARTLAQHTITVLERTSADYVVAPSGSCTAMLRHFGALFDDDPWQVKAQSLASRCFELSAFLIDVLGIDQLDSRFRGRVTWHDACHGLRDLGIRDQPRRLLRAVPGIELIETEACDACCGFGGTFSVKYPELSVAMVDHKIEALARSRVDAVVSGDVSCLMQLNGRLARQSIGVRALHLADVLAEGHA